MKVAAWVAIDLGVFAIRLSILGQGSGSRVLQYSTFPVTIAKGTQRSYWKGLLLSIDSH